MPALSDTTTWRTAPHKARAFLYLSRPAVLLAARVNMASPTFPLTSIDFDGTTSGSYADVKAGHTLFLGSSAGASDKGIQRVRSAPSSTAIPVGRSSDGTLVGELSVANDLYITVLAERRIWAKIPRITDAYELLKDEQSYSDALALAPVVIMGSDFAARVDATTGKLTVTFDGSDSYAIASGATISTYLWDFDGGTITVGTTGTATATVEFDPGEYDVSLTVTDSDGKASTGYRWIVAVDRTPGNTYAAIPVEIGTRTLKPEGQAVSVTVRTGSIPYGTYPRGTRAIIFEEEVYGSTAGSLNDTARGSVKFTGWLGTEPAEIEARREGRVQRVTLDLFDIGERLRQIPQFPQVLHRKATATTWAHAKTEIANLDGAILYYLRHHTTALELADFRRSAYQSLYTFSLLSGEQGSPYEQCDRLAKAMRHRLTVNSRGQLAVTAYPGYLPTSTQASDYSLSTQRTSTVIVALGESDWARLRYTDSQPPGIHWNNGSAILISTQDGEASSRTDTPLFCIAPGTAPGQGLSAQESGEQLALSQDELNVIEGNRYAANNAVQSLFELELTRGGDAGIEPALMEWITLTVSSATAAQRGLTLATQKMLPIQVEYELDGRTGVKRQRLTLERETSGQPATTVTRSTAILPPYTPPETYIPDNRYDYSNVPAYGLPSGVANIATINTDGYVYLASSFNTLPVWTRYLLSTYSVTGTPVDFVPDAFVPNAGWMVTTDSADTYFYRFTDIAGTPTYTLRYTATGIVPYAYASWGANIETNRSDQNFVICNIYTEAGGWYVVYTEDDSMWTERQTSTQYETSNSGSGQEAAAFVSGRSQRTAWFGKHTASGFGLAAEGGVHKTTDGGASDSAAAETGGTISYLAAANCIHVPYSNEGYVFWARTPAAGPTDNITLYRNGTDISAVDGSNIYGPRFPRGVRTADVNGNYAVLAGRGSSGVAAIWSSTNALSTTPSWTRLTNAGETFEACRCVALASDGGTYYAWGGSGLIASAPFGSAPIDKRGNIPVDFPSIGRHLNIMGVSV